MEIGFENLGVDLVDMVEVGALVELGELLFQESPTREPCGHSSSHRNLHLHCHSHGFFSKMNRKLN